MKMKHRMGVVTLLVVFGLGLCPTLLFAQEVEGRAVWVTRWTYKNAEDVIEILDAAKKMNFNQIMFQVRGNATVFYKSEIEPWAWELSGTTVTLTGKNPGWDPLKVAIEEGHKRGLEIHAYMNVCPGWHKLTAPPPEAHQLWTEHPDWFMVGKDGKRMPPIDPNVTDRVREWYSFVNPAKPEVRDYLTKIFVEVVKNYDLDGLHYDYVRYPGEIGDFSHDPVTLEGFKKKYGITPDQDEEKWVEYRSQQIVDLIKDIKAETRKIRPNLIISASVGSTPERAKNINCQDSTRFLREGLVDINMPMIYTRDMDVFETKLKSNLAVQGDKLVYPGMSGRSAIEQIKISRRLKAPGVCIFSFGSLYRNGEFTEVGKTLMTDLFKTPAVPPKISE